MSPFALVAFASSHQSQSVEAPVQMQEPDFEPTSEFITLEREHESVAIPDMVYSAMDFVPLRELLGFETSCELGYECIGVQAY
jgi:hypothetical protein